MAEPTGALHGREGVDLHRSAEVSSPGDRPATPGQAEDRAIIGKGHPATRHFDPEPAAGDAKASPDTAVGRGPGRGASIPGLGGSPLCIWSAAGGKLADAVA